MSSDLEKKKEKRAEDNSKKAMEDKETCGDYLIMDVVGRGAFGVVYRAVHRNKGNWVAIKRVILNRKKKMQLTSLMMEIDLLKSLEHPNIVQYIDHVCSEDYLSIIMEYIENGSLESVLRKHGKFPETLVATYMAQVVEGLNYLHDQGVIHRDIKGANILITTAGKAKLADFGVSTKLSDISNPEDSFAGTPYWMAPEIITMSGATTACDIWSVGCTIIELLTGIPPYGNLPAAASLYRIVQDDHPPIPEGITPALQDLLLQCFKKDVNMRITAANLLHHPWLTKAQDSSDFNVVEKQIQQYKKALDRDTKSSPSASPKASRRVSKEATAFTHKRGKENGTAPSNPNNNNSINIKSGGGSSMGWVARLTRSRSTLNETGTVELISHSPTSPPQIARAERNNGSNKNSKKSTPPFVGEEEEEEEGDEDYDSDENFSEIELSKTVKLRRKTGRAQPQDLDIGSKSLDSFKTIKKQGGLDLVLSRQASSPLVLRTPNPEDVVMELDIGDSDSDSETLTSVPDGKTRDTATSGFPSILRTGLGKFVEIEENSTDDFLDGIELEENGVLELHDPGKHFLSSPTASTGGSASTSSNEFDAFNNIIEGDEEDKEALLRVRQLEQLKIDVVGWIQLLSSSQPESVVLQACENLVNAFRTQPKKKKHLISNTAIIQLLNMMDVVAAKNQWKLLQAILQVINEMLSSKLRRRAGNQAGVKQVKSRDNPLQTNFCLLGGIPAVTKFAAAHYPKHIRLEAARFITQMSHSNPLALHMFIACGGLSVLVTLLEPNYHAYRTLVCSTINCIWSIFHLQILPKNDFCHLFTKCGLLERLSIALTNVHKDSSVRDTLYKVSDVFFYFSQASLDSGVQKSMCEPHVLTQIKHVLEQPVEPSYHVLWLLHTVRNLLVHAEARPFLEKHSFAEILLRYLERREEFTKEEIARCCPRKDSKGSLEEKENVTLNKIHNQVLNALFLFCQLDHRRQERAAMAGIIPSLIYFIEVGRVHFLKELAITVFLDLPHASSKVRELLWRCDSFPVFTRLLKNSSWFVEVLQCLLRWRRSEPEKMNLELEKSADKLVGCFSFYNKPSFVKAVEPILTIVQECPPVNLAMSEAGVIPKIIEALEKETNAHVRASLLKIVHSLLEHHPNPRGVAHQTGLLNAVKEIYRTDQRVFVQNICGRLLALKQLQDRKNPTTYQHKKVMKQLRSNRNSAS